MSCGTVRSAFDPKQTSVKSVVAICFLACAIPSSVLAQEKNESELDHRVMGIWNWTSSFDVDCWRGSSFGHTIIDRKLAPGIYAGVFTASMQTMEAKRVDCTRPPANPVSGRVVYKVLNNDEINISNAAGDSATFVWTRTTLRGSAGVGLSIGTKQ